MSNPIPARETFTSRLGLLATMIGAAVGLGNVWRFPYMVGAFGGAGFVLFYLLAVFLIGIPALLAEWILGRHTRRGPVGAFARAGTFLGKPLGWFLFFVVCAATAYYTNVIGWVLYTAVGTVAQGLDLGWRDGAILPPATGIDLRSLGLQLAATAVVILACVGVLIRGLRAGIEVASKLLMPVLVATMLVLVLRSVSLPGAWPGVEWYLLKLDFEALTLEVVFAAVGQAIFSLSLGGTFMVAYGSYLGEGEKLQSAAVWTALGDLGAGLFAGLVIFPAVFAFGLAPGEGPGLVFSTLPRIFAAMPLGGLFGLLFFVGLLGVAYLSDLAAFEVLVAGLTDNTRLARRQAVWLMAALVFLLAIPPMLNMGVFTPWDLTFGSGMQTLGAFLSVLTTAWCVDRASVLKELGPEGGPQALRMGLYLWLRFVVPGVILTIGVWWLVENVF